MIFHSKKIQSNLLLGFGSFIMLSKHDFCWSSFHLLIWITILEIFLRHFACSAKYCCTSTYNYGIIAKLSWVKSTLNIRSEIFWHHDDRLIDWLIEWIEFYAVSAIFQPCNGGVRLKEIWIFYTVALRNAFAMTRSSPLINLKAYRICSTSSWYPVVYAEQVFVVILDNDFFL